MAIKRIPRVFKEFTYEGVKFALRPPVTGETMELTRMITAFQRSLKHDLAEDKKDDILETGASTGDTTLMQKAQNFVAEKFVVDFDSHEQYFGDREDQYKIGEVPTDFINEAWFCYSNQNRYISLDTIEKKLGKTFADEHVHEIAFVERRTLMTTLAEKYPFEKVQDLLNVIDGKVTHITINDTGEEELPNPTTTAATTTSSSGEQLLG